MDNTFKIYSKKMVAEKFGLDPDFTGSVQYRNKLRSIVRKKIAGSSIIDVGCGNGLLLAQIHDPNIIGVDFSHQMIREAKKRQPNAHYVVASAEHLPFKAKVCDIAVCIDMLHHLDADKKQLAAIDELIRISRKQVIFEIKTKDFLTPVRTAMMAVLRLLCFKKKIKNLPLKGMAYHSMKLCRLAESLKNYRKSVKMISPMVDWRIVTIRC